MPRERIQRYLARAGLASRRTAEEWVRQGRVRVNGVLAAVGQTIDPEGDEVTLDGRPVARPKEPIAVALHKPPGVLSAARDPRGRTTVVDLVPLGRRLYPVGRLDYDSEGLILLTDDGDLAQALMHPRHGVPKTYRAWVRGEPDERALGALAGGIPLDGRPTAPAEVRRLPAVPLVPGADAVLEIVLREGRKRQVRRMCKAVGHPVVRLQRVAIGPLALGSLAPGAWRVLGRDEVEALRRSARGPGAPRAEGPAGGERGA